MKAGRDMDDEGTARADANREASNWLILLQEDPDDAQLQSEFSDWLTASPANIEAWTETRRITHVIETEPPAYWEQWRESERGNVVSLASARGPADPPAKPRRHLVRNLSAIAAAACLALVAAPEVLLHLRADALAGTGETRSLQLADGSTVMLAPQSAVAVNVSKAGERQIDLLRGRAYFEVAPDAAHPFTVATRETTTTVLGTAFEVRAEGNQNVAVEVKHGRVRVSCDGQSGRSEQLGAGDALDLGCDDGWADRRTMAPSRIAAWTDNRVIASDRSVREVIDALRPWYGGVIMTFGDGLDERRVTGVYDTRQPEHVLRVLARSHGMRVRNVTPWVTVISAD